MNTLLRFKMEQTWLLFPGSVTSQIYLPPALISKRAYKTLRWYIQQRAACWTKSDYTDITAVFIYTTANTGIDNIAR